MRVVLSTIGKFHSFDLARQMDRLDALSAIYTGYPRFKLRKTGLDPARIRCFPWIQTLYMARARFGITSDWLERQMAWLSNCALDRYLARTMPQCDVLMALSNTAVAAGRTAHEAGALYVCDTPHTHARYQDRILREEFAIHGASCPGIDPRIVDRQEQEYAMADAITVASRYVERTFVQMGVDRAKIHVAPYGVNLSRFHPCGEPDPDEFNVLYVGTVSIRKGIPYLLDAFDRLRHPKKRLSLVGILKPEILPFLARRRNRSTVHCLGHQPQETLKNVMSRSHVMVLPSVDEGFGMVLAEAMACGCPVIATANTGGPDLITDGKEGFIVPIRDADAISARLEALAQCPEMRAAMSAAALEKTRALAGWDTYGDAVYGLFNELLGAKP
jgi:glycosyltransferase involved in cell wall biosynthesis